MEYTVDKVEKAALSALAHNKHIEADLTMHGDLQLTGALEVNGTPVAGLLDPAEAAVLTSLTAGQIAADLALGGNLAVTGTLAVGSTPTVGGTPVGSAAPVSPPAVGDLVVAPGEERVVLIDTDATVLSLPEAVTCQGARVTALNVAPAGTVGFAVSPAATDMIAGTVGALALAGTPDKDLEQASAAAVAGDHVTLWSDGVTTWWILQGEGTFTLEV